MPIFVTVRRVRATRKLAAVRAAAEAAAGPGAAPAFSPGVGMAPAQR